MALNIEGEHGRFSLDAAVRIAGDDRAGLERLLRCCARPAFALDAQAQCFLAVHAVVAMYWLFRLAKIAAMRRYVGECGRPLRVPDEAPLTPPNRKS